MLDRLKAFENKQPEIVFSWKDPETEAEGWIVINSLRGGAAGGGTRMRKGLNLHEVVSLAKTMEIKFSVCGPAIGGAKSGINFDPADPRKEGVLRRWYKTVLPILKTYYGTGGDLNVDEIKEVLPITKEFGLEHCQEGVAVGHFKPSSPEEKRKIISRLQEGVSKKIDNKEFTPDLNAGYVIADMITGWGVSESVLHFYHIWKNDSAPKKVIIQGFGNVGGAAAFFMAKAGFRIVGIIDRHGGLIEPKGLSLEKISELLINRKGNALHSPGMIPYDQLMETIWDVQADIFLPCARSRVITRDHVQRMKTAGVKVISCGANVPFDDTEIFLGPTGIYADDHLTVIPDFIANCGMARAFAYFMGSKGELTDEKIFSDNSNIILEALKEIYSQHKSETELCQAGLEIALDKLK